MSEFLTKGTKVSVKESGGTYKELPNLVSVGDIGGEPEKLEVTNLQDASKRYIKGLVDYDSISLTFNYDDSDNTTAYRILQKLEADDTIAEFKLELPTGTSFTFSASVGTVIKGIEVNNALQFEAKLYLNSEMTVAFRTA